jgi:hypothetical protein
MVEYLYNAIKAVSGQEAVINAYIADDNGNIIKEDCYFVLCDGTTGNMIAKILGSCADDIGVWDFILPKEVTEGLRGRYMYYIQYIDSNLCFKQPIYFV